jgi:hypothetical protein
MRRQMIGFIELILGIHTKYRAEIGFLRNGIPICRLYFRRLTASVSPTGDFPEGDPPISRKSQQVLKEPQQKRR